MNAEDDGSHLLVGVGSPLLALEPVLGLVSHGGRPERPEAVRQIWPTTAT